MADLGTAYVQILPSTKGLGRSLISGMDGPVGEAGKKSGSKLGAVMAGAAKTGIIAAGVAIVAATGLIVKKGFDRALDIEDAQATLRALGYTAQEVLGVTDDVLASVKGTPFALNDAMSAGVSALAAGVEQGEALTGYLTTIGDAATVAKVPFESMADVFNKVQATGKVTGRELMQMGQMGIPILQWLADEYGVTADEMTKMVSAGEVDAARFQKAIADNVGGAALAAGETTRGAWANMMAAMGRLGAQFVSGILPQLRGGFEGVIELLDSLGPIAEKVGEWLGSALSGALEFIQSFLGHLGDLRSLISGDFFEGLSVDEAAEKLGELSPIVLGIWEAFKKVNEVVGFFRDLVGLLSGSIFDGLGADEAAEAMENLHPAARAVYDVFTNLKASFEPLLEVFRETGRQLREDLGPAFDSLKNAWEGLKPVLGAVAAVIGGVLAVALGIIVGVFNGVANAIAPLLRAIGGIVAVVTNVFNLIKGIFTRDGDLVKKAAQGIIDGIVDVFAGLKGAVEGFMRGFVDGIVGFFTGLYNMLVGNSIIPDMIDDIVKWFAGLPGKVFRSLGDLVRGAVSRVTDLRRDFIARIRDLVTDAVARAGQMRRDFIARIGELVTNTVAKASEMRREFVARIGELVTKAAAKVGEIPGKFATHLSGLVTKMKTWGRNALQAFIDGISEKIRNLGAKISEAVAIVNRLNPFTRESPSLVDNVLRGTGVIQDAYEGLSGMRINGPSVGGISSGYTVAAPSPAAPSQTINFNQPVRTYSETVRALSDIERGLAW